VSSLKIGYVTNGFRDHALEDVFAILAELGYRGVGITLDVGHLDPYRTSRSEVETLRRLLHHHGLEAVIETGARFLLDPRRKHYPTLLSAEGRERRMDFLARALELAEALGSRALSFWSGARDPRLDEETTWRYLLEGLEFLAPRSRDRSVSLAFEPEPGMFIESLDDYRELRDRFSSRAPERSSLGLTLDLGHLQCTEESPHDRWIREFAPILDNVHVDDCRNREHKHLPLGEGDIDFPPLLDALSGIGYRGLCLVELSRQSHAAPEYAARSMEFLRKQVSGGIIP
jgi:sugar phosphate isomerase/epimerase